MEIRTGSTDCREDGVIGAAKGWQIRAARSVRCHRSV
jgi:hypothetical protein